MAEEIGRLSFDIDDRYAFQLTDRDTGLSYRINPAATAATSASVVSLDRIILTDHGFKTGDAIISTTLAGIPGTNLLQLQDMLLRSMRIHFKLLQATAMQLLVALNIDYYYSANDNWSWYVINRLMQTHELILQTY